MTSDNVIIVLDYWPNNKGLVKIKEYGIWLRDRNIKYSWVKQPEWSAYPTHISMRKEDALLFRLTFDLL
jgi:hypothetical protein